MEQFIYGFTLIATSIFSLVSCTHNVTHSTYMGCWPYYSLIIVNHDYNIASDISMLQTCRDQCQSTNYQFFLLQIGCLCDCANFTTDKRNQVDAHCADNALLKCAISTGMYAVYSVSGNGSGSASTSQTTDTSDDCQCDCTTPAPTPTLTFEDLTPEQQNQITEMKKNLTVDKTTLSSYIRAKTSAKDDRPTAQGIGSIGILMLVLLMGTIVLMDADNIIVGSKTVINTIKHLKEYGLNFLTANQSNTKVSELKPNSAVDT